MAADRREAADRPAEARGRWAAADARAALEAAVVRVGQGMVP
jgi:hypothetical protein